MRVHGPARESAPALGFLWNGRASIFVQEIAGALWLVDCISAKLRLRVESERFRRGVHDVDQMKSRAFGGTPRGNVVRSDQCPERRDAVMSRNPADEEKGSRGVSLATVGFVNCIAGVSDGSQDCWIVGYSNMDSTYS